MDERETGTQLVAVEPPRQPSFARIAPGAAFISQLIAARDRLAPQRERRRAPVDVAVDAYDSGSRIAIRRMPPGYRRSLDV